MTQVANMSERSEQAAQYRNALTDGLLDKGVITSPRVEQAFRAVPRESFAPAETPLEAVYDPGQSVVTKSDEHGVHISSISAPFIQALMLERAQLRPGMNVLEVGSGGCNAALLAEVVGPTGRVVSADIDAEVIDRARAALADTAYGERITLVQTDAEHGVPEAGPFDRIVITVGAWDIPPAWLEQLAPDGMIVIPLRMRGITRVIAFCREADHLVSTSAEVAGFVAMQGEGERREHILMLPDGRGRHVKLRFEDGAPQAPHLLDGVLGSERTVVWSGVTTLHGVSFADLHLWFASYLTGFCMLAVDDGVELAQEEAEHWFPFGVAHGDSFAYLVIRPALEGAGAEFGAGAFGPHGRQAAEAMVEQIQAWDRLVRGGPASTFAFWPNGGDRSELPEGAVVLHKAHGLLTISWHTS